MFVFTTQKNGLIETVLFEYSHIKLETLISVVHKVLNGCSLFVF